MLLLIGLQGADARGHGSKRRTSSSLLFPLLLSRRFRYRGEYCESASIRQRGERGGEQKKRSAPEAASARRVTRIKTSGIYRFTLD